MSSNKLRESLSGVKKHLRKIFVLFCFILFYFVLFVFVYYKNLCSY